MPKDPRVQLLHRLNRIQGQIGAIKKQVEKDHAEQDCLETLRLVKAANNANKKFAEAYLQDYIQYCVKEDMPQDALEARLKEMVSLAFSL